MLSPSPANMIVVDYCIAMDRQEIRINREYQRSDKVWPEAARSYLIESIVLGFPIPKLYHHLITNIETKRSTREVVDGQQRSKAIHDFYSGKFKLTGPNISDRLRGRFYEELEEDDKGAFLTYMLSIDLFTGASPRDVRQVFRRMNSYTVPLNPEELRHAIFQGRFKWFIARLGDEFQQVFKDYGVLTERSINRMQDLKLLTECSHALLKGVKTTNKNLLEKLYSEFDDEFPLEDELGEVFNYVQTMFLHLDFLRGSILAKPFIVYSMLLAFASHQMDIPDLENEFDEGEEVDFELVRGNFALLEEALELDEEEADDSPFAEFIAACSERTNVKDQRETRIRWMMRAFEQPLG